MRKKFLNIAKKEALKSTHQFLVGAILVNGSNIVSKGHNKPSKTHRLVYWNHDKDHPEFARMHAEIDSLINVPKEISEKCTLYVVRLRKSDKKLAMAKPCDMCMQVIKSMRIKKVIYSIAENHYGIMDLKNGN